MSSNNDYDKLTDTELHTKLKAIGYDLPISINRDFLVRKLQQAEGVRGKTAGNNVNSGTGSPKPKRLSLNVQPTALPVVPNKRLARNSIAVNHQSPPPVALPQVPAAPPTPPRNRKPTPPRQIAKPALPPPQPNPPSLPARRTTPPQPQAQRIPFTNRYRNVEESDKDEESAEEAEGEAPVRSPTFFGANRKSTSLQVHQPPKPPSPAVSSDRLVKYMKLFNNHEENNDRGNARRFEARGSASGFSSDDDSGDDTNGSPYKPRSSPYRSIWNKITGFISGILPGIPKEDFIRTLFVTFFMLIIGIYLFNKFQNSNALEPVAVVTDNRGQRVDSSPPICGSEGADPSAACIPENYILETKQLFHELRTELDERRRLVDCKSPEDERAMDNLSSEQTKSLFYRLSSINKQRIDATFQYLLYFIIENPKLGLIVETELSNGTRGQLSRIDQLPASLDVYLTTTSTDRALICVAFKFVWNTIWTLGLIAVVAFVTYGGYQIYTSVQRQKTEKQRKLFSMVEDILNLLQEHHENAQLTNDEPLAIHHIRDNLIQPSERTSEKMQVWDEAIQYILNHESRVREEMHHIKGEEYRVLKWLPTISPKRANLSASGWQGQAFEMIDGSPNSLPLKIPTNCLKVRHMYDTTSHLTDELKSKIEASINSKAGIKLKHIGYDNHNDCCVYMKCFNKEDAKTAYLNLHGNWYNGKLLSVKFLREERYNTRFPAAAGRK